MKLVNDYYFACMFFFRVGFRTKTSPSEEILLFSALVMALENVHRSPQNKARSGDVHRERSANIGGLAQRS